MDNSIIDKIAPLSQQQRIQARQNAVANTIAVIGKSPKRDDFVTHQYGRFPNSVRLAIMALVTIILVSAFILSAMRLYDIGNIEFAKTIPDKYSAIAAGIFIILLAEASTVLFMIAISVIGDSRISKGIMLTLAILATAIALAGNYYVALHGQETNVFSWLEALSPPIITIGTSYVLERFIFGMIEQRHRDQIAFDKEYKVYQQKVSNPERHDYFVQAYANAIWDQLLFVNRDRRRKHDGVPLPELLAQASAAIKNVLVSREFAADTWYRPGVEEKKETPVMEYKLHEVARQPGFQYAPSQAKHLNQE